MNGPATRLQEGTRAISDGMPNKECANVEKHGVDFMEASTVFGDPFERTVPDPDHSFGEHRFLSLGASSRNRVLVVSYAERSENRRRGGGSGGTMNREPERDTLRPEYDFTAGVRGRHHRAYRQGTNVVLLEPDVAAVFKDAAAVNAALRALVRIAAAQVGGER